MKVVPDDFVGLRGFLDFDGLFEITEILTNQLFGQFVLLAKLYNGIFVELGV